jgi:hypothetical protein
VKLLLEACHSLYQCFLDDFGISQEIFNFEEGGVDVGLHGLEIELDSDGLLLLLDTFGEFLVDLTYCCEVFVKLEIVGRFGLEDCLVILLESVVDPDAF